MLASVHVPSRTRTAFGAADGFPPIIGPGTPIKSICALMSSGSACRRADVCAVRRTGLVRELAAVPRIDVVLHRMCRPARRHPTGLAINKERTSTRVEVEEFRASPCRSAVHPGDDPSPVALINGGDDPNIVAGRHPGGQVLLRQLSRLGGVQVPRHKRTVTPSCARGRGHPDLPPSARQSLADRTWHGLAGALSAALLPRSQSRRKNRLSPPSAFP
jgi:hypothetical protein